jgi:hypothetical protein
MHNKVQNVQECDATEVSYIFFCRLKNIYKKELEKQELLSEPLTKVTPWGI